MTSPGVVYIDGDEHGLYEKLELPANWTLHVAPEQAGLSAALRWCLATHPDEPVYGWLADDMQPRTVGWDRQLEEAAGVDCMAQANDLWAFERDPKNTRSGLEPTAGLCWGGDLIRAVGWWAFPGSVQAGTDVAWGRIIHSLDRMRFREDVVVEHLHWRLGKREQDPLDTDMLDSNGHLHTNRDLALYYEWAGSREPMRTVHRVRRLCPLPRARRIEARRR